LPFGVKVRAGGRTPRTPGQGSRMLRDLMLGMGHILWACAGVQDRQKIDGQGDD